MLDMFKPLKYVEEPEEEIKAKKYSPRDIVIALFTKEPIPEHIVNKASQYSQFMVNRWLACTKNGKDYDYIELVNYLNTIKMSNMMHYQYLLNILPKKNTVYPGYAWNKADDKNADKMLIVKALKWKYKYNDRGAELAIHVIPKDEIENLVIEYRNYSKVVDLK